MRSKEKVTLKWSKKENDWITRYPEWQNRNGKITGNAFFGMIERFEKSINQDLRSYLKSGGFDSNTFTISVNAELKE